MTNQLSGQKYLKRFRRWQGRLPLTTQALTYLVEKKIVPVILSAGFMWVDMRLNDKDWPMSCDEIQFERSDGIFIDCITIAFQTYYRPQFQIDCSKYKYNDVHDQLLCVNLVQNSRQYYHFWGKPWWMPHFMWSEGRAERVIDYVAACVGQLVDVLDTGHRGPNIGRSFERVAIKAMRG